ncbi:hypothetical protein pb186bvf_008885 [Paramecium bursaria]
MGTGVSSKYSGSDETDTSQDRRKKSHSMQDTKVLFDTLRVPNIQVQPANSDQVPEQEQIEQLAVTQSHDGILKRQFDTFQPLDAKDKILIDSEQGPSKPVKLHNGIYEGQWSKKKPHGFGVLKLKDGTKYKGEVQFSILVQEWVYGSATGRGEYWDNDGGHYVGEFHQNSIQGRGRYRFKDGGYYDGQWLMDKYHRSGELFIPNVSLYKGKFVMGKKEGSGYIVFNNQHKYEGHFSNDLFEGHGIYKWDDGREYTGDWHLGLMHGNGILKWPDGRCYVGRYKKDKRHGQGTFMFADGKKYIGLWLDGLQHGSGEFHDSVGNITKGTWRLVIIVIFYIFKHNFSNF